MRLRKKGEAGTHRERQRKRKQIEQDIGGNAQRTRESLRERKLKWSVDCKKCVVQMCF